jgi:hypothetical protein
MRYANIDTPSGVIPVFIPNTTQNGEGFYVSHNDYDISSYGDVTTALVFGQMQKFYILNGDHRAAYSKLISQGFEACLAYFKENMKNINMRSDTLSIIVAAAPAAA